MKRIHIIDTTKIKRLGAEGGLMTRLALATHDFITMNNLFMLAKGDSVNKQGISESLVRMVIRIQIGFLSEAILILHNHKDSHALSISNTDSLLFYIRKLSQEAQESYHRLQNLFPGNSERDSFDRYVNAFRNRVAFHYDWGFRGPHSSREEPVVAEAINFLASKDWRSDIVLGSDLLTTHFNFADEILDTIVSRVIFSVPASIRGTEFRDEVNQIIDWIHMRALDFIRFSGELCEIYFIDKASA